MITRPQLVVLGGPNGAGKTTASTGVLRDMLWNCVFVNADSIAVGLSGYTPERSAFAAGRIMLEHLHQLAVQRADFAFETTMASRTFVPWLRGLRQTGYRINMVYMWVRSATMAVTRVRQRVANGGHAVPEAIVRRRYERGLANFFHDYIGLADSWRVYDNSRTAAPRLVAQFDNERGMTIHETQTWRSIIRKSHRRIDPLAED